MNDEPKHTVITSKETMGEETVTLPAKVLIHTKSYYEQLARDSEEVLQNIKTDEASFLKDLIAATQELKSKQTRELSIEIKTDENYRPRLIVKRYLTKKRLYNKK